MKTTDRRTDFTHDQHVMMSHWRNFGGAGFVRKLKGGWIIESEGICSPLGKVPVVFKTKRAAVEHAENLVLIRAKEWRGI